MHILIVEDDEPVLMFLRQGFEGEGYAVDVATDGQLAQSLTAARPYDLIILDLTLPKVDGIEVLKHLRGARGRVPVLVLSSRREVEHRVSTLDLGADDYLPKPFAFSELAARVRALLRRSAGSFDPILRVDDLELHRMARSARRGGRQIELTPKELALLEYLMENAGDCVTRAMIIEHVWKMSSDTVSNVVDVYINYLRKKVDGQSDRRLIYTLRGSGYSIGLKKPDRAGSGRKACGAAAS
ncbi:MAG: response regulator transcription factor [Terriglobia bacterium]